MDDELFKKGFIAESDDEEDERTTEQRFEKINRLSQAWKSERAKRFSGEINDFKKSPFDLYKHIAIDEDIGFHLEKQSSGKLQRGRDGASTDSVNSIVDLEPSLKYARYQ